MIIERVPEAWAQFQMHVGGLSRPNSEEEYEQIINGWLQSGTAEGP